MQSKQLPKNSKSIIPVIPLRAATLTKLDEHINSAPEYKPTEFRRLVMNTIGAIHQIPRIFHKITGIEYQLKQVEAYFGRSSGGNRYPGQNIYSCFNRGLTRKHEYGMAFARTSIAASLKYEKHGIRVIDALRDMDGLCISNKTLTARGGVGSNQPGLLYMTFRILQHQPEAAKELSDAEIRQCIRTMKDELIEIAGDFKISQPEARQMVHDVLEEANHVDSLSGPRLKLIKY